VRHKRIKPPFFDGKSSDGGPREFFEEYAGGAVDRGGALRGT
jgi:hypothetical protein